MYQSAAIADSSCWDLGFPIEEEQIGLRLSFVSGMVSRDLKEIDVPHQNGLRALGVGGRKCFVEASKRIKDDFNDVNTTKTERDFH